MFRRSHLTLGLCTVLHLLTHAYGTMLVPLYFLMRDDLKLSGVKGAALIVTVYGTCYYLGSFAAGVLADRFDRKMLLGISILGNAAAIALMGFTHQYSVVIALGVGAGLFGTMFHPSANALVTAHYPKNPGMAIGLLGMGSGLGFFFGPQFSGWRAKAAQWNLDGVAAWQRPCVELGLAGMVIGIIFLLIARDANAGVSAADQPHPPLGKLLARRVFFAAVIFGSRDFAGVGGLTLMGIYLHNAFNLSVETIGAMLGLAILPSTLCNPLLTYLTFGRWRLGALTATLIAASLAAPFVPLVSWKTGVVLFCVFETLQCGSYALSDSAMLERVRNEVRGRVVGLFLLVAGTCGAIGPWIMGAWTDGLGKRAADPRAYIGPFIAVGAGMLLATLGVGLLNRLGPPGVSVVEPLAEISPETMGIVG